MGIIGNLGQIGQGFLQGTKYGLTGDEPTCGKGQVWNPNTKRCETLVSPTGQPEELNTGDPSNTYISSILGGSPNTQAPSGSSSGSSSGSDTSGKVTQGLTNMAMQTGQGIAGGIAGALANTAVTLATDNEGASDRLYNEKAKTERWKRGMSQKYAGPVTALASQGAQNVLTNALVGSMGPLGPTMAQGVNLANNTQFLLNDVLPYLANPKRVQENYGRNEPATYAQTAVQREKDQAYLRRKARKMMRSGDYGSGYLGSMGKGPYL